LVLTPPISQPITIRKEKETRFHFFWIPQKMKPGFFFFFMRILGVIDLLDGRAVHARGGERQRYAPVASVAGDAVLLAQRYLEAGVSDLYVADLNAILGLDRRDRLVDAIADLGAPMWLDAGVTTPEAARGCLSLGADHVVVGLETLRSFDDLSAICEAVEGERVAFSLDLRNGEPIDSGAGGAGKARGAGGEQYSEALAIVGQSVEAGVSAILVLDLARVGTGSGIDVPFLARVRATAPRVTLIAGGGIRGARDVALLAEAGCDGALVATAFHEGSLGAAEIRQLTQAPRSAVKAGR
jgi:phosphoribosylformimino-5-aminoimidazole carboxamide ribotide isomerase